jgi:hypothetical protein
MAKITPEKEYQMLQRDMRELQQIRDDIERAKRAKVPGIEAVEQTCNECIARVELLKREYHSDKV